MELVNFKNELHTKRELTLAERQLLIAVIQAQREIRQEEMLLIDNSEEDIKDEINTYLEDL